MRIRPLCADDNAAIAQIIRENLEANGLNIPGTVYFDDGLDCLSEYYAMSSRREYFVAVDDGDKVVGGIGLAEFEGLENCAELQKLYLTDDVKGNGYGYVLIDYIINKAVQMGYGQMYLETHSNLETAIHMYEKSGFYRIEPLSECVQHSTMNRFYLMNLEDSSMKQKAKIIAVAGKGGVGKTSLAAVMVRTLAEKYPGKRILAIDADPAVGLSTALNIDVKTTIDDIRKKVVASVEDGDTRTAMELLGEAKYNIFDAITEGDVFSFIAVGRPESAGCYCKVNSYLKDVISLVADNFDYVVIDGEAGVEQINRRVMEKVTHLILVSDMSRKGLNVIQTIKQVADNLVMYDKIGVIVNRIPNEEAKKYIDTGDIPLLACIGQDDELTDFDMTGKNVFLLPDSSSMVQGVREAFAYKGEWV